MKTVHFKTLGIDVIFERKTEIMQNDEPMDNLTIRIDVPVSKVRVKLKYLQEFKRRIQFFPGLASAFYVLQTIEDAILEEIS